MANSSKNLENRLSGKEQRVISYMKRNGSIDSDRARNNLGDSRLAATIFNLREKGYKIDTIRVDTVNRYGEATWYGKYVFANDSDQ